MGADVIRGVIFDRCAVCRKRVQVDEMGWLDDLDGVAHQCWTEIRRCPHCKARYRAFPRPGTRIVDGAHERTDHDWSCIPPDNDPNRKRWIRRTLGI